MEMQNGCHHYEKKGMGYSCSMRRNKQTLAPVTEHKYAIRCLEYAQDELDFQCENVFRNTWFFVECHLLVSQHQIQRVGKSRHAPWSILTKWLPYASLCVCCRRNESRGTIYVTRDTDLAIIRWSGRNKSLMFFICHV